MNSIESLVDKAMKYKEKGLKEKEIATELNLSIDTVTWLLTQNVEEDTPPTDVKIGWSSIGTYGERIDMLSSLFADIIWRELEKMGVEFDTVVGVAINGIQFATLVSRKLGKELAVYRPPGQDRKRGGGALSSNFADVKGKKVVIIDDVISTSETMEGAITDLEDEGAEVVFSAVTVNKDGKDEVVGVPLKSVINAKLIGR